MVEYNCTTCNKTFNRKSNYDRHKNRNKPCKPNNFDPYEKIAELERRLIKETSELEKKLNEEKIEKMKRELEIANLKIQILENNNSIIPTSNINEKSVNSHNVNCNTNINNINTTNTTNNNKNTFNIINNFGKEKTDFLTSAEISACLAGGLKGNADLFELIHYHPDYPENHNVKMKKNSNTVLAYNDGKWVQSDQTDIAKFHLQKATNIYNKHLHKKANTIENVTDSERDKFREMTTYRDDRYTDRMKNMLVERIKNHTKE